jgi:hypothetical protein
MYIFSPIFCTYHPDTLHLRLQGRGRSAVIFRRDEGVREQNIRQHCSKLNAERNTHNFSVLSDIDGGPSRNSDVLLTIRAVCVSNLRLGTDYSRVLLWVSYVPPKEISTYCLKLGKTAFFHASSNLFFAKLNN